MLKELTLYLMRHGETEDNRVSIITGQADSPLTELGREQARVKGALMRLHAADLCELRFIASPLHRACVTMELARRGAELQERSYETDRRLMEMDFGTWTRRRKGEDKFGVAGPTAHQDWNLKPPGGESQAMVHDRVGLFLQTLRQNAVLVCHARIICMIRSHYLGLSAHETMAFEPPNGGIILLAHGREVSLGN